MKKKEVSITTKKVVDVIDSFSDLKVGDCMKELELNEICPLYCKVIDIGDENIVVKLFRKPGHYEDYDEYTIIDSSELAEEYAFIFADKKEIMAWLI